MATPYTVNDTDVIHDDDVNQYYDIIANQWGITSTVATAPTRAVFPKGTSAPSSPEAGQFYFDTSEGRQLDGGRMYVRQTKDGAGNAIWVPYQPLRQLRKASTYVNFTTSSTGLTDVTNATLSIVTTGGVLRIEMVSNDVGPASWSIVGGASSSYGSIECLVAAVTLLGPLVGIVQPNLATSGSLGVWEYHPPAGTYTVKLRAAVAHATSSLVILGNFRVTEFGDDIA